MAKALEQTKGSFKLVGVVKGIDSDKSIKEGFTTSDKAWKNLSFYVQTSKENNTRVELFGMEKDLVYAYSQKAKQSKPIKWEERFNNHNDFKVMGVNMFLEEGKDGKNKKMVQSELDAIDYMTKHISDGDVVRVNGEIDFQEFTDGQGDVKKSAKFIIKSITKLNEELDFESEDFKEVATFQQEIIVTDTMVDTDTKKLHVYGKVIKYKGELASCEFVVDADKLPKLANNMSKRLGYGDFIKLYGHVLNLSIRKDSELEDEEEVIETEVDDWGGDDEVKKDFTSNSGSYITEYIRELQITDVDGESYTKKKYREEDLQTDADSFGDDGDEFNDIEEDDLPFK